MPQARSILPIASPRATLTRPIGLAILAGLFGFGVVMSSVACVSLLAPGTRPDGVWRLNPEARAAFGTMGLWAIVLLAVVALACGLAAYGVWTRAPWGHAAAVSLLTINLIGDVANAVGRGDWRTLIGLPIAGAAIAYLLTPRVRRYFAPRE